MKQNSISSSVTVRPLTILVADDSLEHQQMVRRWLEEAGHQVSCAGNGDDAVRFIKQQHVDLVVTEVIMPNGDGLEVILQLKKHQPEARAIAISGGGRYLPATDCLRVAKGLGAYEGLFKPARRQDLLLAVERTMAAAPADEVAAERVGLGGLPARSQESHLARR